MLDIVRFLFASIVLLSHLWLPVSDQMGAQAVTGFYITSGYLITRVLNETYGFGIRPYLLFIFNRALRLFPAYWLFALLTIAGLWFLPQFWGGLYSSLQLPFTVESWAKNISLFNTGGTEQRLIPQAWSLSIEFFFYLVMPFYVFHRKITCGWWIISIVYTLSLIMNEAPFADRYYPAMAASTWFASGSMLYHFRRQLPLPFIPVPAVMTLFCVIALGPLASTRFNLPPWVDAFYGVNILSLLIVGLYARHEERYHLPFSKRLGDLSYPLFVNHFFAAGVTNLLTLSQLEYRGALHTMITYLISLCLAYGWCTLCDVRIQKFRHRIREQARTGSI